jgi:hypothetical protein
MGLLRPSFVPSAEIRALRGRLLRKLAEVNQRRLRR